MQGIEILNSKEVVIKEKFNWKWFWTPHFGAKKWIKCKHCEAKRHFMERQNWNKPWWFDWYK